MSLFTGPLRSGGTQTVARLLRRGRADHWSFLFGQIAVYSFAVAVVTGVFLAVFFEPSMTGVTYHGSYHALNGVQMSQAYKSALHISFDVRGGLLIRQIHHWAALIFVAAVCLQLLRLFFTGAFRRPRGLNWLIWVSLLVLGMAVGWTGGILPNDIMSGGSLGVLQGVLESIPVVGTHLMLWVFGGDVPGHHIIPRLFWVHVLLPVAMAGLFVLRRRLVRQHGHTRFAGPTAPAARIPPARPGGRRGGDVLRHLRGARPAGHPRPDQPGLAVRALPARGDLGRMRCRTGIWASSTARCGSCRAGRSKWPAIRSSSR